MRLGKVIGKVTLSKQESSYKGGRFLIVQPLSHDQIAGQKEDLLAPGNSLVTYDNLGAGKGDIIGYVEGREAAVTFSQPTPVDAFNCAIIDKIFYNPPHRNDSQRMGG